VHLQNRLESLLEEARIKFVQLRFGSAGRQCKVHAESAGRAENPILHLWPPWRIQQVAGTENNHILPVPRHANKGRSPAASLRNASAGGAGPEFLTEVQQA
jgi:hypothetical protein